ncbi:MAG: AI-2E family transporter [Bacteroidales bacterium]
MVTKYPFLFTLLGLVLAIVFVWYFSDIVIYVLVSAVLSVMGHPLVNLFDKIRIRNWGFPRGLSAFLTLMVIIALFSGFIWFFVPLISDQARIISQIDTRQVVEYFQEPLDKFQKFLIRYDIIQSGETIHSSLENQLSSAISMVNFSLLFKNLINATGSFFIGIFSVLFLTFFFLKNSSMLSNFIILLVPEKYEQEIRHIFKKMNYLLSRYFLGLLGELVSMITLLTIGLTVLGIKNALIIGFIGGLMNIIPYLGPVIGAIIGTIIGMTTALSFGMYDSVVLIGFEVVAVFVVCNLIDNILLQPLIYSNVVKAHPVEIFLVIIMAGSLAGIPGMILAIPGYTVLRIIAKEFLGKMRLVRKLTEKL